MKKTKFREGVYIVITGPTSIGLQPEHYPLGYIFRQDKLEEYLHSKGVFNGSSHGRANVSYRRDTKTNWRFASNEEVNSCIKNNNKPLYVGTKKSIDNFSII